LVVFGAPGLGVAVGFVGLGVLVGRATVSVGVSGVGVSSAQPLKLLAISTNAMNPENDRRAFDRKRCGVRVILYLSFFCGSPSVYPNFGSVSATSSNEQTNK
jgi:hypothetical protein